MDQEVRMALASVRLFQEWPASSDFFFFKEFVDFQKHLLSCSKFKRSYQNFYDRFGELKSNLDRVNFVLEELNHAHISASFLVDKKSDLLAEQMKQQGNLHYGTGDYVLALDSYSKCLVQAESKELLALCYANRSAVLYKLNLFNECLEDIDRALANEYPEKLRSKLIRRRQESLKRKNQQRTAEHEAIPQISNKNPKIQCASDSVEISHNEKYGKHVIATKDIEIGEVIAVEDPFACVREENYFTQCCRNCARFCYNPVPCPGCTVALYCNEVCKEKAFEVYHKYECAIAKSLEALTTNSRQLLVPLRMAFIIEDEDKRRKVNVSDAAEEDEMYRSDRSTEILKLISHADKRSGQELLKRTVLTALMFQLVKTTNSISSSSYNYENKFKTVLLNSFLISSLNTCRINLWTDAKKTGWFDVDDLASGIYSFFSLFNHSCCPNVMRAFYGSKMVLRAVRTIKKGGQCFVSYGCLYGPMEFSARQEKCRSDFFFTCSCQACEKLWPLAALIPKRTTVGKRVNLAQVRSRLRNLDVMYARSVLPELLDVFKKSEHMEPCRDLHFLHHLIMRCYYSFSSKRTAY